MELSAGAVVVVCTMEGSSMVDGREIDREWCASVCVCVCVCVCVRESVWVLLCCVEDAVVK